MFIRRLISNREDRPSSNSIPLMTSRMASTSCFPDVNVAIGSEMRHNAVRLAPILSSRWLRLSRAVSSCLDMLATHDTSSSGSPDNLFLHSKCEFDPISSEHYAPPVIARTNPGRPASLLNGWNRDLWPINVEFKDSEDQNCRVSGVANLNPSRATGGDWHVINEFILVWTCSWRDCDAIRTGLDTRPWCFPPSWPRGLVPVWDGLQ